MDKELLDYINEEIIPRYDHFDKGHGRRHVLWVIQESLRLGAKENLDTTMCHVIAAYHDLGLEVDRKTHHTESARILLSDAFLSRFFTPEQMEVMAQAIRDHRASGKQPPKSLYGAVVADSDRQITEDDILRRCIQYGLKEYPTLSQEEHVRRSIDHLLGKYQSGGYMRLYLHDEVTLKRLEDLRDLLGREEELKRKLSRIYLEETGMP